MTSNTILTTFLSVEEQKNKNNGERYYILHLLCVNTSCKLLLKILSSISSGATAIVSSVVTVVAEVVKNPAFTIFKRKIFIIDKHINLIILPYFETYEVWPVNTYELYKKRSDPNLSPRNYGVKKWFSFITAKVFKKYIT